MKSDAVQGWSLPTRAVVVGRPTAGVGAAVNEPVTFTSTYHAGADLSYARVGNPTWAAFEQAVGALEGGAALAFPSGMAAIAAVLSGVPHRGVIVAPHQAYSGTTSLLDDLHASGAAVVRRVDIADTEEVRRALAHEPAADLLVAESPTNPMLEVADLSAVIAAAHEVGAVVMVDNTFATPLLQRPLEAGADVVIHSATKYLSGHSDVLLGVAVTPHTAAGQALGERLHTHRTSRGSIPGPMEVWLALRGLRTLAVRVERSGANAAELVPRLRKHPAVQRVRYPGWGAIIAIEVGASVAARGADAVGARGADPVGAGDANPVTDAERVCAATRLWVHSTSLGGVESQIERRRRHSAEVSTVPQNLIRLSVGIESVQDLWADLKAALDILTS
ncbi:MAG: PLP-dependent transferase [Ornithinimicrobium sp.]